MDIENGYFLATFRSHEDFLTVLADDPWTIFGHYLTVEPWSPDFSPSQPYPSKVVTWIRLPGLSATLYKWSLIEEIGNCIGLVVRIDYQTESGCRGRFARMEIRIDLNKPLVSKLLVNDKLQVIEYESLPTVCFECGKYGHVNDSCPTTVSESGRADPSSPTPSRPHDDASSDFGLWMLVEKNQRRPSRKPLANMAHQNDEVAGGSRFNPLFDNSEDTQLDGNVANPVQANTFAPHSPNTMRKGKQPAVAKLPRAVNVRKPSPLLSMIILLSLGMSRRPEI
ncbi:hypothetical protein V6N12_035587 [Hibiscus sabdariffa]|uniref:CCHC-type domain-containing protein n=1 Tax=Hibiscus sabdariffa TaxID=183260 RepID=A0ABR2EN60_9ROSI